MGTDVVETIGRYRILREVGRGGMGVVYEAEDPQLGRRVALKVLPAEFTFNRSFVDRFLREGRLAASLSHPSVVTVYEAGEADGKYFLAMEFINGTDLGRLIREKGRIEHELALEILEQVAAGLDAAHAQGIVHRDIKPENVLLDVKGAAKVADFGIARAQDEGGGTRTGTVIGTAEYISPEQALGKPVDARSDVYSLGCVAYEMLTGTPPFGRATADRNAISIITQHAGSRAPSARSIDPAIRAGAAGALAQALEKQPQNRFASAGEFVAALRLDAGPTMIDRRILVASALGIVPALFVAVAVVNSATAWRGSFSPEPTVNVVQPSEAESAAEARAAGEISVNPVDGAEMVWVPPGGFMMGSEEGDEDERPVHPVRITQGFWLYRTEVTNEQYGRDLAADPGAAKPAYWTEARFNAPDQPVVGVSWDDAAAYCRWARARLPTEAEWEYAARGPEGRIYPWGNQAPESGLAAFGQSFDSGRPAPAGRLLQGASWCGALDMAGNVLEWCADWYAEDYYGASPAADPEGPAAGTARVLRGGSWYSGAADLRASIRIRLAPGNRSYSYGFRAARTGL